MYVRVRECLSSASSTNESSTAVPPHVQCLPVNRSKCDILTSMSTTPSDRSLPMTAREKRAVYMSQLRGSLDSDYRRTERTNNARAMRKKRLENPLYREHERRQNRAHMAAVRRENSQYRQREHEQNRDRMAGKRKILTQSLPPPPSSSSAESPSVTSVYQTLETNLQSSHISFIPYQPNLLACPPGANAKPRTEYELLQQIDEFCRQQEIGSGSDSNSRSTSSC